MTREDADNRDRRFVLEGRMLIRRRRIAPLTLAALLLTAGPLLAQDDTVNIGARPTPGQSQRLRTTQSAVVTMTPDGTPPPGFPPDGLRVDQESVTLVRQDIGLVEADGRVRHDITYESMTQTAKMNGKELPLPGGRADLLNGKSLSLWLDAKGDLADVIMPDGFPLTADQTRAMLAPMVAAVPRQPIRVGESVTRPLSMNLPVPAAGPPPTISATTRLTLRSIDGVGTDRVATFDIVFEGRVETAAETTGPSMAITMEGTGRMRQHVVSGLVIEQTSDQTIDGVLGLPAPGAPRMRMRGTVHLVMARVE